MESGESDFTLINDINEFHRQTRTDSHMPFMESKADQRQKVKRTEVLTRQLQQTAIPVQPGSNAGVKYIKDEKYFELHARYQAAFAKGEHKECDFQPLSTYQHKITKARPILTGEVGTLGWDILCLEPGYGTGNFSQVPAQLENKKELTDGAAYDREPLLGEGPDEPEQSSDE